MRLDEYVISGATSFEIVVSFECTLSFEYHLDFLYFSVFERSIEQHRYTTPEYRESMIYYPESDPDREYAIYPPESEILREKECDEDPTVHDEVA